MSFKKSLLIVPALVIAVALFWTWSRHSGHPVQNTQQQNAAPSIAAIPGAPVGGNSTTASNTSGTSGVSAPTSAQQDLKQVPSTSVANGTPVTSAPVAAAPSCFKVSFKHQAMNGDPAHADEEACSHHRNLIRLGHNQVNPASVCIRVNGTPVKFKHSKEVADAFEIGPIAGPHALITAQFCVGKHSCSNVAKNCKVPRDEFMDAIGGSEAQAADAVGGSGHWDSGDEETTKKDHALNEKVENEVKRTLAESSDSGSDVAADGTYLFKQWIGEEVVASCE